MTTSAPTGWTGLVAPSRLGADLADAVAALPPLSPPAASGDRGLAAIAIHDAGEALVALDDLVPCGHAYRRRDLPGVPERTWSRATVAELLVAARRRLPRGFDLWVLDAWRSPATQRALYDEVYGPGSTLPPGFVADPDDPDVPPPHTTGAAVDLTLSWRGRPLALGTDFDSFEPRAHLTALEADASATVERDLRRLLAHVLGGAGFVGLVEEWWHVSYGDQRWALHHGTTARYGPTAPPR